MDSKKKYDRNRHWKKKYQPKNTASTTPTQNLPKQKNGKLINLLEENSDEEFELKQPLPKNGWFPEYDSSSSDSENFESLENIKQLNSKQCIESTNLCSKKHDENWFDQELDNIQYNIDIAISEEDKKLKEKVVKSLKVLDKNIAKSYNDFNSKLKKNIKSCHDKNEYIPENDEDELDFLLSLKEPVHTGPVNINKNFKNERSLAAVNGCSSEKPIKSIDLEKWLDSVLDV